MNKNKRKKGIKNAFFSFLINIIQSKRECEERNQVAKKVF